MNTYNVLNIVLSTIQQPYEVGILLFPFTNENTEARRLNNLSKTTQLVRGRLGSVALGPGSNHYTTLQSA